YGTGISLVADASKLLKAGLEPKNVGVDVSKTALYQAIDSFMDSIRGKEAETVAGPQVGYTATVVAMKAHEAALKNTKIAFDPSMFDLTSAAATSKPPPPKAGSSPKKGAKVANKSH